MTAEFIRPEELAKNPPGWRRKSSMEPVTERDSAKGKPVRKEQKSAETKVIKRGRV